MPKIVPATAAMVHGLPGDRIKLTCKAVAAVEGDQVLGIGGIYLDNAQWVLFMRPSPEARENIKRYAKAILRGARALLDMTKGLPVSAVADPRVPGADRLLHHLGFKQAGRDVWIRFC